MDIYAPSYYHLFSCIGKDCRHNCCENWEIDVDDFSYEYYKSLNTPFSQKITDNIYIDSDGAHFCLADNRCPFLREDGLCDIIATLGQEALCDICADHPRFRNYYDTRTEIGLGLCCEEAARIIVCNKDKFSLVAISKENDEISEDVTEQIFFDQRDTLFDYLQNDAMPFSHRLSSLAEYFGLSCLSDTGFNWQVFQKLEYLSCEWENFVCTLTKPFDPDNVADVIDRFQNEFQNLLCYFVFRHISEAVDINCQKEKFAFCIISVFAIAKVCANIMSLTTAEICDMARLYSSEVEYSDINVKMITDSVKEDDDVRQTY